MAVAYVRVTYYNHFHCLRLLWPSCRGSQQEPIWHSCTHGFGVDDVWVNSGPQLGLLSPLLSLGHSPRRPLHYWAQLPTVVANSRTLLVMAFPLFLLYFFQLPILSLGHFPKYLHKSLRQSSAVLGEPSVKTETAVQKAIMKVPRCPRQYGRKGT